MLTCVWKNFENLELHKIYPTYRQILLEYLLHVLEVSLRKNVSYSLRQSSRFTYLM